jgi:hypothetical protein
VVLLPHGCRLWKLAYRLETNRMINKQTFYFAASQKLQAPFFKWCTVFSICGRILLAVTHTVHLKLRCIAAFAFLSFYPKNLLYFSLWGIS